MHILFKFSILIIYYFTYSLNLNIQPVSRPTYKSKVMADDLFRARQKHSVVFKWKRGDVLMLDNILAGHGRMNVKPPREILVCFGNMYSKKELY